MECIVSSYCFCIAFFIQNENFNKHACMLIQQRSHTSIGSMIAAVAHKNHKDANLAGSCRAQKLSAFS